jgi:hypothetical protein
MNLYWQAWYRVVAQAPHLLPAAETGVLWDPDFPITGQVLGLAAEKERSTAAAERTLEVAAAATTAGSSPWTAVEPLQLILLLVCQVIGMTTSLSQNRITWHLERTPPIGLRNLRLGSNQILLVATTSRGDGLVVVATAKRPFQLEIDTGFTTFLEHLPAGQHRLLLAHLDRTDVRQV